jgi:ParB-like chromosome segregation protein Spo0J
MKIQNVPIADIVPNPWRDMKLYPLDDDHVAELRASIADHGFFGGVKGSRINGKVELGCGHSRIEAARAAKLDTVPIFIGDIDDDGMLRLMTDENATQSGSNPGAVLNEVAAVTRRIIDGVLSPTIVPLSVAKAFENQRGIERTKTLALYAAN